MQKTGAVGVSAKKERRPQDWKAEQRLVALHETHGLMSGPNCFSGGMHNLPQTSERQRSSR